MGRIHTAMFGTYAVSIWTLFLLLLLFDYLRILIRPAALPGAATAATAAVELPCASLAAMLPLKLPRLRGAVALLPPTVAVEVAAAAVAAAVAVRV